MLKQAWPKASAPYDKTANEKFNYLKDLKSAIRNGLESQKSGGKKKKGAPVETKTLETAYIFTAREFPEF